MGRNGELRAAEVHTELHSEPANSFRNAFGWPTDRTRSWPNWYADYVDDVHRWGDALSQPTGAVIVEDIECFLFDAARDQARLGLPGS